MEERQLPRQLVDAVSLHIYYSAYIYTWQFADHLQVKIYGRNEVDPALVNGWPTMKCLGSLVVGQYNAFWVQEQLHVP